MSHNRMPSTPNARSTWTAQSTTPAGPPPSHITNPSTTPAGPPPQSSLFGGSSAYPTNRKTASFGLNDEYYDDEDDAEGDTEDYIDDPSLPAHSFPQSFTSSMPPAASQSLKRSRGPRAAVDDGKATKMRKILEGQVHSKRPARLNEPDTVVVGTERVLTDLTEKIQRRPVEAHASLAESSAQLTGLWSRETSIATKSGSVGPESKEPLAKAHYIASLLLQLHHPHSQKATVSQTRNPRSSIAARPSFAVPLPKGLLDWLNTFHMPFPDDYEAVRFYQPSPSAHEAFWDVLFANTLRGKLDRVVDLLQHAGWEHACSAADDDPAQTEGYRGYYLDTAADAASQCADVVDSCPALRGQNWDVKGVEWNLFRSRVELACNNIRALAGDDLEASQNGLGRSRGLNLSTASRRANSRIPPSVGENFVLLYGLLLGNVEDIIMVSQDWLEASLYLTIWWDGTDEEELNASLSRSNMRKSNMQKPRAADVAPLQSYRKRLREAYLRVSAEEDPAFQFVQDRKGADERAVIEAAVNTLEPVLTAIACVLVNECPGGIVDLLQSYSQPLAVAVVELGSMGRWLPLFRPKTNDMLGGEFTRDDLIVLNSVRGRRTKGGDIDRDEVLIEYAERLAEKPQLEDREGWELAVAVLNRLDQAEESQTRILELLETLELADEERVDNILGVCDQFNLVDQRRAVAERFADSLAADNRDHGAAIIYYARAHAESKLKDTIVLLTSLCLLHSSSYPLQRLVDPKLAALLTKDRKALKELARTDMEAATTLSSHLSGYATVRRFYDLRDQDVYISQGDVVEQPLKSLERRRQAASALFAVIKSSADCITGGLYDPEIESVVPSEGLLALFGEALPLLGHDQRIFTEAQVFSLLTIIEDFVASPSRIRENANSLLSASLTAYKEGVSTASGILKKQRSDLSASSSWDMLASQSVMAQSQSLGKNAKVQRAWDWRQGLVGMGGADTDSKAVIKLVREALIREVAGGWGGRLNW